MIERERRHAIRRPGAIPIVDDDAGTCETFQMALTSDGYEVETASSGYDALRMLQRRPYGLSFIDLRLPDMCGVDIIRAIDVARRPPFVLMSAFLTTDITVQAMKLGAVGVVDKPLWIDQLQSLVTAHFRENATSRFSVRRDAVERVSAIAKCEQPASTPERWAQYVLKGCRSMHDLTTGSLWADCVGASYTTIAECCRLLGIHQRDARDLMRLLRALMLARAEDCPAEALLLVADSRTLDTLFERAGLTFDAEVDSMSVDDFLDNQRFVDANNPGLKALRRMLAAEHDVE